jgi:hypothetical protein
VIREFGDKMFTFEDQEKKPLLSLESGAQRELHPDFIPQQAAKLHLSLGVDSPGMEAATASLNIDSGLEMKRLLAQQEALQRQNSKNEVLNSIMQVSPENITPEMVDVVQGLSMGDLSGDEDLGSVIERNYAKKYTNLAIASVNSEVVDQAISEDPEGTFELMDRTERVVYKNNMISSKSAELQKRLDEMSWGSTIWNFGERFVPFLEWYQKQNAVGSDSEMVSSILPGNNLEEQFSYLWSISDPKQFNTELSSALQDIEERNPMVAQSWLQGLVSYGASDSFLESTFAVADAAGGVSGVMKGVAKSVAKASLKSPTKVWKHSDVLGRKDDAAMGKIIEDIKESDIIHPGINGAEKMEEQIGSIYRPLDLLRGSQSTSQEAYNRLKHTLFTNSELAQTLLGDVNLIDRLSLDEIDSLKTTLKDNYVKQNPSIQKNVIDVKILDETDMGNVYRAEVILGRRDGSLFETEKEASAYFKRWIGGSEHVVRQEGQGFHIMIPKVVDESLSVRIPTSQQTPSSFANTMFGWARSPNYTVGRKAELARSTAVTSGERMREVYGHLTTPFRNLPKNEMSELNDLMSINQHSEEFKNFGEFESAFWNRFKKPPTTGQAEAYLSGRQMMDLEYVVTDLDIYKQKAVKGIERFKLKVGDEDLSFEGKVHNEVPFGSDDFSYVVVKDGKAGARKNSRFASADEKAELQKLISEGYKVIETSNRNLKSKSFDKGVGFVITKSVDRSRPGLGNIPRRPGGHKVDTYKGYIKQPSFVDAGSSVFHGKDLTFLGVKSEQTGREVVDLLNQARVLLKEKKIGGLEIIRDQLGLDAKAFMAAVKKKTINLDEEFIYTPKGMSTSSTKNFSAEKPNLKSGSGTLDDDIFGRYIGERDASNIKVIESEGDSVFEVKGAEYLSPIDTLALSAQNSINARVMNDYTIMTARDFLSEFGDILKDAPKDLQRATGADFLMNPVFVSGADPSRVARAKNVSRAYKNLLNRGTYVDNKIDQIKDKILTSIKDKFGGRIGNWASDRLATQQKDPGSMMRAFAFHTKLGLFNPKQYFIQANGMINIASIAGADGMRGMAAYPITRWALAAGESRWAEFGARAERARIMSKSDFVEGMALLKRSGWNAIGGDVSFIDALTSPELAKGSLGKMKSKALNWGQKPFEEGERSVRLASYMTAYLERKKALGPGRTLSRRDEVEILQRAKDLTGNMTRESNAAWQKGYAGVLTQFFGYQARIMEQFTGAKLTGAEKLRLFMGYSTIYGIPTAVGAATGVLPVRDIVLDSLSDLGYDIDNTAVEPFVDGLVSTFVEYLTDYEPNFADRYGPGGLPTFYDLFREDSSWSDLMLGASGGIMGDALKDTSPIFTMMASEFADFEGGAYTLTVDDVVKPLRNITTVDDAFKLYQVYNTGVWASKNGTNLMEMDLPEAVMAALTGLQPAEIEDAFRKRGSNRRFAEEEKKWMNELTKEYKKVQRMDITPEREQKVRALKALGVSYGLSVKQMNTAWRRAMDENMMLDNVLEKYQENMDKRSQD